MKSAELELLSSGSLSSWLHVPLGAGATVLPLHLEHALGRPCGSLLCLEHSSLGTGRTASPPWFLVGAWKIVEVDYLVPSCTSLVCRPWAFLHLVAMVTMVGKPLRPLQKSSIQRVMFPAVALAQGFGLFPFPFSFCLCLCCTYCTCSALHGATTLAEPKAPLAS